MKIILGKQIEEIKKKDSETEKNLLKNRNSVDVNELDENEDDVYFHSNAVKNIKLGTQLVNRIYLNNNIIYDIKDTILLDSFHSLVPKTATEIKFLYASDNPDLTDYQRIGYCDDNNFIEVWNNNTKYIIINPRKNYIYAPVNCSQFLSDYTALSVCIFDNFDTRNTTNMRSMLRDCSNLITLDLSNFNTVKVTDMGYIFIRCSSLRSINLSNFNTEKVKDINGMFHSCTKLSTLDVSSFNTQKVYYMSDVFYNCSNITSIISHTFNTASVGNGKSKNMFGMCYHLVGGNGTTFSSSHITAEYARVDGENGLPGYFTAPANNNK